jgi:hypothetical protein
MEMHCVLLEVRLLKYYLNKLRFVYIARVEAGTNTSIVALRVVGGDEKGTQCLGYNRVTLFLGGINTGTWPSRLGESQI